MVLIDTRNNYEFEIGSFKGAINPNTETFRQFPSYTKNNLEQYRNKKIAMFCTGGIRCEKSTAYLKAEGFENVYHLQGGILKYLEEVEEEESLWEGECFVFDDRVAVKHNLELGQYDQCHACRYPITEEDKIHPHLRKGNILSSLLWHQRRYSNKSLPGKRKTNSTCKGSWRSSSW